ncbi:MAG: hypothetical protein FWE04_05965 [Oscillospiraceae bacterium]|nr:hypothetical protein [Oscillospiraceae bacterium]
MPKMPYSKKAAVNYFTYSVYAIIMAAIYGLITYFGIFARGTEGFALRMYIWNLGLIIIVLLIDKIYLTKLKKKAEKRKTENKRYKALYFVSFKASLYLFYIFALTASRLMMLLDSGYALADYSFRSYLLSIEYGLILLVAVDKFIDQFVKDKKQMKEIAEE